MDSLIKMATAIVLTVIIISIANVTTDVATRFRDFQIERNQQATAQAEALSNLANARATMSAYYATSTATPTATATSIIGNAQATAQAALLTLTPQP
jgi:hypothetical protein